MYHARMFEWAYLRSVMYDRERTVYKYDGVEVARLSQKVTGEWIANLNQHLPFTDPRRHSRDCRSFETGKRGIELWGFRHAERLRREVEAIRAKRPKPGWLGPG